MRKEDITSIVVYLVLIAGSFIIGTTVIKDAFQTFSVADPYLVGIGTIIVGIILNVCGLELLHALGAKIGGYEVVSINIVGFCFEKLRGKWTFKFKDFDGLTGETKVAPRKEKRNLKWFMWMPLLGYLIEVAACVALNTTITETPELYNLGWLAISALLLIVISSIIALYNIVPFKLDSMTDGYRLVLISKKVNSEAFDELMRVENLQRNGEKVSKIKVFDEITEFTASVNLLSVYEYLNEKKYAEANKIIEKILGSGNELETYTRNRLMAQKVYIQIMEDEIEEAKKFYNEQVKDDIRRFIANDDSMESLRAYALIAAFLEDSESEVEYTKSRLAKILKKTLPSRAEIEQKLYKEALDKIAKTHKDWFKKENAA